MKPGHKTRGGSPTHTQTKLHARACVAAQLELGRQPEYPITVDISPSCVAAQAAGPKVRKAQATILEALSGVKGRGKSGLDEAQRAALDAAVEVLEVSTCSCVGMCDASTCFARDFCRWWWWWWWSGEHVRARVRVRQRVRARMRVRVRAHACRHVAALPDIVPCSMAALAPTSF